MKIAGLMSGTSVDAIDVALCELSPSEPSGTLAMQLLGFREEPFPPSLRAELLHLLLAQGAPFDTLAVMNFRLGRAFASAVLHALEAFDVPPSGIDLIASHGQTIYHRVEDGKRRTTLQMGEPSIIVARTGVTVAADFRVADVAAGGQGAPLAACFDRLVFGGSGHTRALQNIGGMANVTFLPAEGEAFAFDTGPGNVLLDYGATVFSGGEETYDRGGAMALAGRVDQTLLEETLSHLYFAQPPPKTTGREVFGEQFAQAVLQRARSLGLRPEDTMATLTAVTAESIARAYRDFGPNSIDEIVLSGGGSQNPALVREIGRRLPSLRILRSDDLGVSSAAKEAMAFALLGHEALYGRPIDLTPCTGASRPTILGKIVPGNNYRRLMQQAFGHDARPGETLQAVRILT